MYRLPTNITPLEGAWTSNDFVFTWRLTLILLGYQETALSYNQVHYIFKQNTIKLLIK